MKLDQKNDFRWVWTLKDEVNDDAGLYIVRAVANHKCLQILYEKMLAKPSTSWCVRSTILTCAGHDRQIYRDRQI